MNAHNVFVRITLDIVFYGQRPPFDMPHRELRTRRTLTKQDSVALNNFARPRHLPVFLTGRNFSWTVTGVMTGSDWGQSSLLTFSGWATSMLSAFRVNSEDRTLFFPFGCNLLC